MPNRNQELLDKLLTALDLEFVDATEGMEDGWYVWRGCPDTNAYSVHDYQMYEMARGQMLEPVYDNAALGYVLQQVHPYGQLAGPILGR